MPPTFAGAALVANRQPAIGVVHHSDPLADCRLGLLDRFQNEEDLVVLRGQRLRQGALLLPGKARVVVSHEGRERRALPPASVAAPASPVRTLDPTLRRARIGADDVDVQRMQCLAKLGHAITGECAWMVDPEDGDRLALGLQIGARRVENRQRDAMGRAARSWHHRRCNRTNEGARCHRPMISADASPLWTRIAR